MKSFLTELAPGVRNIESFIAIEPTLRSRFEECIAAAGLGNQNCLIVSDANTHTILGKYIAHELAEAETLLFADMPHADMETVELISKYHCDAIIAVGSGTINDLCKYASFLDQKPYAVFPTAPSMNGYLSANASITIEGHKQSLPAHLPVGVFCDVGVIAAAPKRLIQSGLGDSLCRSTAQADWLLSHLLLGTPYSPLPFEWLLPYETALFAQADKLIKGDIAAITLLLKTLLISGLGMVSAGGSYPASQGEHLIAHTMEMLHGSNGTFHGEQIGVTTLTMAAIQERLLATNALKLKPATDYKEKIHAYFGNELSQSVIESYETKVALLSKSNTARWQEIQMTVAAVTKSVSALRDILLKVGAPATPAELGWNEANYRRAVDHAHFIRDRFTFLDLI